MPTYRLYGLVVASAIPLPGLAPITDRGDPDVVVRETTLSPASESDDDLRLSVTAGEIAVDEDEIRVDGTVGASATPGEPSLETYLLGWGIATLCHLRGRLVLHASAVRFDGCTVAFLGDSGRGKSTTAAALADCGADVVCDDVLPLAVGKASETAGENRSPLPTVAPGPPFLKLDGAASRHVNAGRRVDPGPDSDGDAGRYLYRFSGVEAELAVDRLYVLGRGDSVTTKPLDPNEATVQLVRNTFPVSRLKSVPTAGRNLDRCATVAEQCRVARLEIPVDRRGLPAVFESVRSEIRSAVRDSMADAG